MTTQRGEQISHFGHAVRRISERHAIPLADMAAALEVSRTFMGMLVNGTRHINRRHVAALRTFLVSRGVDARKIAAYDLAAQQTMQLIDVTDLSPLEVWFLSSLAKRLRNGEMPTPPVVQWLMGDDGPPPDGSGATPDSVWD